MVIGLRKTITRVLPGEGTPTCFPDSLDDNSSLSQLVDVAAPAGPRMIDRSASVVVVRLQLQQCPCVTTADRTTFPNLGLHYQNHFRRSPSEKPPFAMMVSAVA